jgi:long-chain fatty acid transport protein
MKRICTLTAAAIVASSMAFGGSFQLNLQGIRQTAMGGTGVANPWDAATIFFNPGGLSCLDGIQAYASVHFVTPGVNYVPTPTGSYAASIQSHTSTPFAVYVGGPIKKDSKIGIGVGVYTPFGSTLKWGDTWTGRYIVENISLESIFIQPTVSYALTRNLSVGAGFIYAVGSVDIDKAIPVQDLSGSDGQATLKGNANGVGFNVGVHFKASDRVQLGLSYRSPVTMKVNNGDATFAVAQSLASEFPSTTSFKSKLPLPGMLTAGVAFKVSDEFTLQSDLVFAGWKRYDSLDFDFGANTANTQVTNSHEPRSYKNTLAVKIGGHYKICDQFAVMAGGAYDPTPTRNNLLSPDAVDADRFTLSCGVTYQPIPKFCIMADLNYTTTASRTVTYDPANFTGAYQIKSLAPAIGISYSF